MAKGMPEGTGMERKWDMEQEIKHMNTLGNHCCSRSREGDMEGSMFSTRREDTFLSFSWSPWSIWKSGEMKPPQELTIEFKK